MDIDSLIGQLTATAVLIAIALFILNQLVIVGGGGAAFDDANLVADEEVPGGIVELNAVQESLGTAFAFDGSGGVNGDVPEPPNGDSELCTFVRIDGAPGTNQTVVNADGELIIQYHGNRTTAQWVGIRYDEGVRETVDVTLKARNAGSLTHVCVREESDTAILNVSGNESSEAIIDGATADTFDSDAGGLNGTLEETRLYETALNGSQRQGLRDQPTAPIAGATPSARIMFDRRGGTGSSVSTADIRFAGTEASVSGAVLADGFAGRAVDGGDIQISADRDTVRATQGGPLDGAPVAFIDYEKFGVGYQTMQGIEGALIFAPIVLIVVIAVFILREMEMIRT